MAKTIKDYKSIPEPTNWVELPENKRMRFVMNRATDLLIEELETLIKDRIKELESYKRGNDNKSQEWKDKEYNILDAKIKELQRLLGE